MLTQSTAVVAAVGQVALDLGRVDSLAEVQIVGAVVAEVHKLVASEDLVAKEGLVA